jgi:putative DNA methylase
MSQPFPIKSPRKLIEVALPLDAINAACAREKSIRHGHPSTLHLWWARRPLAAARAVIFAQLVNDPGYQQGGGFKYGKNKKEAAIERKRLFKIIEDLVLWENTTNEVVLERARAEIRRSWREVCELNKDHPQAAELFNPDKLPALHDPFAGGGAIPLEAQRLGLEAYASDLNPVAVLINKAMIEIPPKFAGRPPVSLTANERESTRMGNKTPESSLEFASIRVHSRLEKSWPGATGLAEDVRYYGAWMREEAQKRIGHLYPPVEITAEMAKERPDLKPLVGQKLTVIAWLWARTVRSPNPAFSHVDVPLASSFILCSKSGKEVYVEPVVDGDRYRFAVRSRSTPDFTAEGFSKAAKGTKFGKAQDFVCLFSGVPIERESIRESGKAQKLGQRLMAIVADGPKGRIYLDPNPSQESLAESAERSLSVEKARTSFLSGKTPTRAMVTGGICSAYGLETWGHLFTPRQLVALITLSDLVTEARAEISSTAEVVGVPRNNTGLEAGGSGAAAYGEAISLYLAFAVDRLVMTGNSLVRWNGVGEKAQHCFGRQALPMLWDFAEPNFLGTATGCIDSAIFYSYDPLGWFPQLSSGHVVQADAQTQSTSMHKWISTDPPYYNNISYADLSEFFYVWLRRALKASFPVLLATISVPKAEELIASTHRHRGKDEAERFFLEGMTQAMQSLAGKAHPEGPITIYYAFKQSDTKEETGTSSAGWVTFLEAVHRSGLQLSGTWPLRTEMKTRQVAMGTNSLASSIVLVCRKRPTDAPSISRREFIRELNAVLPEALDEMTKGSGDEHSPVAPVDLSQAIIGPGMAIFSKYNAVLEADGSPMTVRTALQLINRFLAEDDFDHDTQFCLHWFEQHGWKEGVFGEADTLARAKGTSVEGVRDAGVIQSGGGKVRLLKWSEYPSDWDPREDKRLPIWEGLHHLIRALHQGGDSASGALLAALGGKSEAVRQLAYRLYTLCERLGQAEDARAYNELITSWSGIESAAASTPKPADQQLPGF